MATAAGGYASQHMSSMGGGQGTLNCSVIAGAEGDASSCDQAKRSFWVEVRGPGDWEAGKGIGASGAISAECRGISPVTQCT